MIQIGDSIGLQVTSQFVSVQEVSVEAVKFESPRPGVNRWTERKGKYKVTVWLMNQILKLERYKHILGVVNT